MNIQTQIDHLVIGARSLTEGVNYVKDLLGVDMPYGGVHPKMGTHNHLMQLGNDAFLEIIAVNHNSEPPDRPRWFGLDDGFIRQRIEQVKQVVQSHNSWCAWGSNSPATNVW